ncbi:MAG: hypothetical protein JWP74_1730 [Marmoricola sp.]|nr:hypothetical protein [Marmoricola sp.]
MTTIQFAPPAKFINANDRKHWRTEAKTTKTWREAAATECKRANLPAFDVPVRIVIAYRFPDNRRRETSNLQPTSKAICDGIVDSGVITDDRDELVTGPDNRREYPNGPHRVTVTITPDTQEN